MKRKFIWLQDSTSTWGLCILTHAYLHIDFSAICSAGNLLPLIRADSAQFHADPEVLCQVHVDPDIRLESAANWQKPSVPAHKLLLQTLICHRACNVEKPWNQWKFVLSCQEISRQWTVVESY